MVEEWFQKGFIDEVKNLRRPGSGGGSDSNIFVIRSVDADTKKNDTTYGDEVQAAIKAGKQIYIDLAYITLYTIPISIRYTTLFDSDTRDYLPIIKIIPMVIEDYQGSGMYKAKFQTADTYSNDSSNGCITLRVSKLDYP